jgi:aspartyl-tRNA(Asn)/glutamyl-tRNA(Gln) amidotransferase subunit B
MSYKPTIGLEIHCELDTESKMFCDCPNNPDEKEANVNICAVCTGHPGTLPAANREAIRLVIKAGLALNGSVQSVSKFDRKNYFYPDLPKGYQVSQYDLPFCSGGFLEIAEPDGAAKKIRIHRVHLEEDTAKLIHPEGSDYSLVDFNRSSVPLMELVTEPDIASAREARLFAEELQLILRYLGVSDADMEKGKMRVEVNISLNRDGDAKLGTKVEIKNLNSLKAVEGSVAFEIKRQSALLERGEKVIQETRGWNESKMETYSQREKEEAFDYRYFPEPDLAPFTFDEKKIAEIRALLPELPEAKRRRFALEYGLEREATEIFVRDRELGNYFENAMSELSCWVKDEEMKEKLKADEMTKLARLCSNYLTSDLRGLLKGSPFTEKGFSITPENFAEFITLIFEGQISSKIAKTILEIMYKSGADPSHIIEDKGLAQISDEKEIQAVIDRIIEKNQKAAADYKKGKENAFQFLIGQVLAATRGKANPQTARLILKKSLDELSD